MLKPQKLLSPENLEYLRDLTRAVLDAATVRPGEAAGSACRNHLELTIIRPGGGECYPAFWTRDMIMSIDTGMVAPEILAPMLRLLAAKQPLRETRPTPGVVIPAGAIPDHIRLDGIPIFYPGAWTCEEQTGTFGRQPPYDDHFYFIHLAWHLIELCGRAELMHELFSGRPLMDRLDAAFAVTPADNEGFAVNTAADWAISFGFTDTVRHGGKLLFASLLRYRAALELADLHRRCHNTGPAEQYAKIAAGIKKHLAATFRDEASGLLRAATGESGQPDVWGSVFAVWFEAVPAAEARRLGATLVELYRAGRLSCRGAIRHVPEGMDFDPGRQCWEHPVIPVAYNTYQHGAYWSTPTGQVAQAMALADKDAARELVREFIADLREHDFRQGRPEAQAPYECFHPGTGHTQNPIYLTSVSCPYAALK